MGYSRATYQQALGLIQQRKLNAEKEADKRKEKVYAVLPRVKEIEKSIANTNTCIARAVVSRENVAEKMNNLKQQNLSLQNELAELLKSHNISKDYYNPIYNCKKCNDKGFIECNGKSIMCSCMKNALIEIACKELNQIAPLSLSTFEKFNLDYYSKSIDTNYNVSPYNQMSKVFEYCKRYANNFTPNSESILMRGATGLGKTHLSLSIANQLINNGFGVIYTSAPTLVTKLEKAYFNKEKDDSFSEDLLIECDLLIIDDLGTEFQTKFSVSHLYNLFNARILQNKPVIINTNCSMKELNSSYTDRFISRICGNAQRLDFIGEDIRMIKKNK